MQHLIQSIPLAHLTALDVRDKSYVLKELQPSEDRLDLKSWRGDLNNLQDIMRSLAQVTAWAHLRGCGRLGAASVEELGKFVGGAKWQAPLLKLAEKSAVRVVAQWKSYCDAYDEGAFRD